MSFHKRNISDYIKDIPMRFSNSFTQIAPENHLNLNDLNPIYVDRLSKEDYEYDFSAERIALEDAQRERERVLREAEQKMRELELSNQLKETQVKKPVEDVINSSQPIQLTNISMVDYNAKNDQTNETANYAFASNYVTPNTSVYNNYNTNAIQDTTQNSLTNNPKHLPQTSGVQSNLRPSIQTSIQSNTIPNNITNPHTQSSIVSGTVADLNYLPSIDHFSTATTATNNSLSSSIENTTRNQTINLSSGQQSPKIQEITNEHHSDDNSLHRNNINQQNNLNHQNGLPNVSSIYSPGLHSHALHSPATFQHQSNYGNHSPVTRPHLVYPVNNGIFVNQHDQYSLHNAYHQPAGHYTHPANACHTVNSMGHQIRSNPSINFQSLNPVPSPIPYTMDNILMPQQSPLVHPKPTSNGVNGYDGEQQTNDKNSNALTNGQVSKVKDNANSMPNNSTPSPSCSTSESTNPFLQSNGKKINVADFEDSSSPFDDALLRSIDEKKELNNVFQQFYRDGAQ